MPPEDALNDIPGPSLPLGPGETGPPGRAKESGMHTNGANEHQHEVSEKRLAPDIFTTRVDMEICACGAKRWVDQDGAPATPWQFMNLRRPGGGEG